MENIIVAGILILIIGFAAGYIIRIKKRGQKCIGCPSAFQCARSGGCSTCNACHSDESND